MMPLVSSSSSLIGLVDLKPDWAKESPRIELTKCDGHPFTRQSVTTLNLFYSLVQIVHFKMPPDDDNAVVRRQGLGNTDTRCH